MNKKQGAALQRSINKAFDEAVKDFRQAKAAMEKAQELLEQPQSDANADTIMDEMRQAQQHLNDAVTHLEKRASLSHQEVAMPAQKRTTTKKPARKPPQAKK